MKRRRKVQTERHFRERNERKHKVVGKRTRWYIQKVSAHKGRDQVRRGRRWGRTE